LRRLETLVPPSLITIQVWPLIFRSPAASGGGGHEKTRIGCPLRVGSTSWSGYSMLYVDDAASPARSSPGLRIFMPRAAM
jgi:hypothetical protein